MKENALVEIQAKSKALPQSRVAEVAKNKGFSSRPLRPLWLYGGTSIQSHEQRINFKHKSYHYPALSDQFGSVKKVSRRRSAELA